MISTRKVFTSVTATVFITALTFALGTPVFAQDLSDNATCMDCHEDADRAPPSNPDRPQVHNPAGGFFQESHADFSCIDCHTYIENLEHDETAPGNEVNCLECHDAVPTKE
jgi:hypothetical protein